MAKTKEAKEICSYGGHGTGPRKIKAALTARKSRNPNNHLGLFIGTGQEPIGNGEPKEPTKENPLSQAQPDKFYAVGGEKILGRDFPEGVLPNNAYLLEEDS